MALPTIELTWRFKLNTAVTSQGSMLATNRRLLRTEKDGMVSATGYGTAPGNLFTVRYACNGTTAGTAGDGVDRWAADSDLVWANAGTAHSWIVLRQAQVASAFEVLISCESASGTGNNRVIVISPSAGFTGGSTTARPTATDEIILFSGSHGLAADGTAKLQQMMSHDGKAYTCMCFTGGALRYVFMIGVPKNPVTGWTNPSWFYAGVSSAALDGNALCTTASPLVRGRANGLPMALWMTSEGYLSTSAHMAAQRLTGANAISGEFPLFPVGLASETSGCEGRHGQIYDLFWGITSNADGDTYPNDATRQLVQIGDLVFPNDGTTWQLT